MKLALIGNGGHAREVMAQMNLNLIRFVDDEFCDFQDPMVRPLSELNINEYKVMIAIGDSKKRKSIFNNLPIETRFFSFIHPTAQIMSDDVKIGEGCFIGANSIITCNVDIGKQALLNRGVQIGHDCNIGDFFSAMPGAVVSGNVIIKDCVYLGTNSTIIEKIKINDNIKIGAGACVVEDLKFQGTYFGVPAKLKN